jgi:glycosyltransferase involved in cell wall biosynthesis
MHARNRPVLGWGLGAPPLSGPLAFWRDRVRRRFLLSLDGLIAYSQRGAQEYRDQGVLAGRVLVAPNAAAARPRRPIPARPPGFVERPAVLFVGRLQARKRVDNLLLACAALPEPLQPRLWVVGDGPARPGLQSLAEQVYPPASFTGALHGPELDELFVSADLFVLPGTGGLAVQQAMSFGLPVIVAQGDGTQDDLVSAGNGWLIPPDDLAALTATMQEALAEPARLRRMGAASYRLVAEQINLENMAAVFVQALTNAAGKFEDAIG